MKKAQLEEAAKMIEEAADAVELILKEGVAAAMNRFNRRNPAGEDEAGA